MDGARERRGEQIAGAYTLGEAIGIGGMGVVYAATIRSGREVAIKLLHPDRTNDPEAARRFHDEALATRRVNHANVVRVLDHSDPADPEPFLVMERLDGISLAEILRHEGPLPIARATALASQVLAGLGAAHAAGVIHADVKSDNVLVLTESGREVVKLIDFGVASVGSEDVVRREMSGTPDYMAPEVIRGLSPGPAADLYAVGVLLYLMLTGETPFGGGPAAAILERQLHDDAIPLSLRRPDLEVPVRLERLILQALEKDPRARPASASAFAAALAASSVDWPEHPRGKLAEGTQPFWTEAPTRNLGDRCVETAPTRRRIKPSLPSLRARLVHAVERGDIDAIVVTSLDIVRFHVDRHALRSAVRELESTIDILTAGAGIAAEETPAPVWRLMLSLAALYLGLGAVQRARTATLAALGQARSHGSAVGCDRASQMLDRIIRVEAR